MPQTTAETQQILIDEVLQKLQNVGPISTDELLKLFLADSPELQQIRQQTLNRIRTVSQNTLDSIVSSLQKELFGSSSTIIKDMADPFGLVEVRKSQIKETETFIKNKWSQLKSELEKIEVKIPKLDELVSTEIKVKESLKTEPQTNAQEIKESLRTSPLQNTEEMKQVLVSNETILKDLNQTLKKLQRNLRPKKETPKEQKVTFSESALDRLKNVVGFDRNLIEQLKEKIAEDPTKKVSTTFKRRAGLFGRTIYESGPKTITLSPKSIKDIMDSLNISNDDQEKMLEALTTETKEVNKEIKETKKGLLDSALFKVGNAFAKVIQDLLAVATFFLGGAALIQIAQSFGPAILNFVDKYFGTNLTEAFSSALKPFEDFPNFFDKVKGFFVKAGLTLVGFVVGLKAAGFLLKQAILGSWKLMSWGFRSLVTSLGRGITNWFRGFKVPPPTTPVTRPGGGTTAPRSRDSRGRFTRGPRPIPSGAVRVGPRSYVLNGRAYSSVTGQPLRGAAATNALKAAARISPAVPTPSPVTSGVGRQLARGVSKAAIPLTVLLEGVTAYDKYTEFSKEVDERVSIGEITQQEGENLKLKAKGRITGETTARTTTGLIGAALTAGAVGAGIGAAGFGVGAVPGFLIGLGAGAIGYYGGTKLSDVSGLTEVAGQAGETTAVAMEEQYGKKPEQKPELKAAIEPVKPTLRAVEEEEKPLDVEKIDQTIKVDMNQSLEMQKQYQMALMGNLDNMTRQLGALGENFAGMGNVINSINIGGGGSGKMSEILISGSRDPVYDARSEWWGVSRRGQMSLYGF